MQAGRERVTRLKIRAEAEALRPMREQVRRLLRDSGASLEDMERFLLALNEACANIIRHGQNGTGDIAIEIRCSDSRIEACLRDRGRPISQETLRPRPPDPERPGGLGNHFMHALLDEVRLVDPGRGYVNGLCLRLNRTREEA